MIRGQTELSFCNRDTKKLHQDILTMIDEQGLNWIIILQQKCKTVTSRHIIRDRWAEAQLNYVFARGSDWNARQQRFKSTLQYERKLWVAQGLRYAWYFTDHPVYPFWVEPQLTHSKIPTVNPVVEVFVSEFLGCFWPAVRSLDWNMARNLCNVWVDTRHREKGSILGKMTFTIVLMNQLGNYNPFSCKS